MHGAVRVFCHSFRQFIDDWLDVSQKCFIRSSRYFLHIIHSLNFFTLTYLVRSCVEKFRLVWWTLLQVKGVHTLQRLVLGISVTLAHTTPLNFDWSFRRRGLYVASIRVRYKAWIIFHFRKIMNSWQSLIVVVKLMGRITRGPRFIVGTFRAPS